MAAHARMGGLMARGWAGALRAGALLFDMDGTLLLSVAVTERAWGEWAARHGLDARVVIAAAHGRRSIDTMRDFAPPGVDAELEDAGMRERERTDTDGIVPVPGALDFLASLPADRWAVVTSADRALATVRMAAAGIPMPAVLVTADDVTSGKPDPMGYRLAAARLGVDPAACVVFEDAPAGLAAGHAAGGAVVALATVLGAEALADEAWIDDYRMIQASTATDGAVEIVCLKTDDSRGM